MAFRIFIVEDHAVVREGYLLYIDLMPDLAVCGAVASGEEALAALPALPPNEAPDLLLVDVSLPGMSGIDLVRALRAGGDGTAVLMVTGHDNAAYREDARRAGAQGFVMKHEGPTALLDAIHKMMRMADG